MEFLEFSGPPGAGKSTLCGRLLERRHGLVGGRSGFETALAWECRRDLAAGGLIEVVPGRLRERLFQSYWTRHWPRLVVEFLAGSPAAVGHLARATAAGSRTPDVKTT